MAEEDITTVFIFPSQEEGGDQGPFEYGVPIETIENIETGDIQTKGGMAKVNVNTKNIKELQRGLLVNLQRQNLFSTQLIQLRNGTAKKLFLLMYNALFYSYNQYYIYVKMEKNTKLFQDCCDKLLSLHQKLMKEEQVMQRAEKNSIQLMMAMKAIIENMKELDLDMKKQNEQGIQNSKRLQDYFEKYKDFPYLNKQKEYYSSYIKQIKIQILLIDFLKILLKISEFIENSSRQDLSMFEDKIVKYLEKINPGYQPNDKNEILFDYFKVIVNKDQILNRSKLLNLQIKSLHTVLKCLSMCDSLAILNDSELSKVIQNHEQQKSIGILEVIQLAKTDNLNIDNRNQITLQILQKKEI